jgi:hypothetical protein
MARETKDYDIEELLIHAIERRNAASAHEIVNRKIKTGMALIDFLYDEIGKFLRYHPVRKMS